MNGLQGKSVISETTKNLMRDCIVWDMVYQPMPDLGNTWESLGRFSAAGVNHVSLTLAGDDQNISEAVQWVAKARHEILRFPDRFVLVSGTDDIVAAKRAGKLALSLHFEGTECFERNLHMVETFYTLGIRQTLIAFNRQNSAGTGCAEKVDSGLTGYGRELLSELQRVGMLIDLSHVGSRTAGDIIASSKVPVIFSHTNPAALHPHWRNISDEMIKACAGTGGVMGVSGASLYMDSAEPTTEMLFRQIEYYVECVGPSHVGFGFDTFFRGDLVEPILLGRPSEWPGLRAGRLKYSEPEQIPELLEMMLSHGYTPDQVAAIAGGNFLRVCQQVWK